MKSIAYIEDMEKWKTAFSFSIPIKIRFSETDLYGHVNNTSVFVYFEEARIEFLKHLGFYSDVYANEYGFVVADLQCDYLEQIYFDEIIDLYVKVEEMGTTSLDIHYMAMNKKEKTPIVGRGRVVMIDLTTQKPTAIPNNIRTTIEEKLTRN